jgi:uncharacterized protein YcgI (DUF1989 family)
MAREAAVHVERVLTSQLHAEQDRSMLVPTTTGEPHPAGHDVCAPACSMHTENPAAAPPSHVCSSQLVGTVQTRAGVVVTSPVFIVADAVQAPFVAGRGEAFPYA